MMMLMLAIGAWAETVTFADEGYSNGEAVESYEGTDFSVTFDKGTNSNAPKYYTTGAAIRVYGGNYFTVSSSTKTISKIEFTFASGGGTNVLTSDVEAYEDGIWEGSSSAVTFTVSGTSGHLRLAAIAVTFDDGTEPPVTVTPPTFSPAAGEVEAGTEVTISAPDAEMIIYTIDGTDPSYEEDNGEIYTEPIVVNEAMTIKAIAVDADDNVSSVASAAYTIKQEGVTCATVAEIKALADDTEFTFTGQLVVSGHAHAASGTNNWLFAQDETGGLQLFKATQDYQKDDVIPSGFTAIKKTYGGAAQLQSMANMQAATETQELVAEELTPAQVGLDNVFKYAVIKGATIANNNITVGEESVVIYNNRFNTTIPTDANTYDVYGITSYYNGTPQFMPLEFVAQGVTVATPVIEGETPFTESTQVTITCETEGASIYYTIDGTEPTNQSTAYEAPFELTESATVKAIAYDVSGAASAVASKEFVKEAGPVTCATVADILALELSTDFTFTGNLIAIAQAGTNLYAQDEAGVGMYFYGSVPGYEMGDVIPGGWSGRYVEFKGAPEISNITGMVASTETAELVPAEMTPAQVTKDPYNLYHYAVIKGASLGENGAIVAGEESVAGYYGRFGVTFPEDNEGKTYDVYGIPSWYNYNAQFIPLEIVEVVEPVVTEIEQLYVVGTFNDWSQVNGMVELTDNGNYELAGDVEFDAGAEFKLITPVGDGWKWFGGEDANGVGYFLINNELLESPISLVDGANFRIEEAGNYKITVSTAETKGLPLPLVMTIKKNVPEAIDAINMENVKAVRYYNVAGVESATPFQGVNIVVREMNDGSKSVIKVVK